MTRISFEVFVDIVIRNQGTAVVMLSEGHTEYRDPKCQAQGLNVAGGDSTTTKGNATLKAIDDKRMAIQTAS